MPISINDILVNSYGSLTKDPTGFYGPENVTVTYDSSARTVTLTGEVRAFYRGKVLKKIYNGWVSDPHPDINGSYFLYYDGSSIKWSTTPWQYHYIQICYVYYSASDKFGTREIHSFIPYTAHDVLHNTVGSYRISGGDVSNYVLSSTTVTDRRPYVSECIIKDEDLSSTLPTHTSQLYTKMYLSGESSSNNFIVETSDVVPLSGAQPYWNEWTGVTWQQTLMGNNTYQSLWLIALPVCSGTNCQKYRFVWMQGQSNGSLIAEQNLSPANLNLGSLTSIIPEFVFIAKVIIRYTGGNWSIASVNRVSGSRVSQIIFPSGNFLSAVSTDGVTITGNGTPSDPIRLI